MRVVALQRDRCPNCWQPVALDNGVQRIKLVQLIGNLLRPSNVSRAGKSKRTHDHLVAPGGQVESLRSLEDACLHVAELRFMKRHLRSHQGCLIGVVGGDGSLFRCSDEFAPFFQLARVSCRIYRRPQQLQRRPLLPGPFKLLLHRSFITLQKGDLVSLFMQEINIREFGQRLLIDSLGFVKAIHGNISRHHMLWSRTESGPSRAASRPVSSAF